ncbi:MAG: DUF3194 domain-containing protein [Candidatus Methanomethyliaceae archaeon]|nr:DUF3194 domain-containing protein [Candidatus Methanomethyliaceae archaeon]
MKTLPIELVKEACEVGESTARKYVSSKVDERLINSLDIQVKYEEKDLLFSVDIFIDLSPLSGVDPERLADEAADAALSAIDKIVRGK